MDSVRLQAFSDGVLAIIITIMVLELKVPHSDQLSSLKPVMPVFMSYILSFIYIGIYWNNHHHLFTAVAQINGKVLWANSHLLFWLSLIPFASAWMGENNFSKWPVLIYGFVLMMNSIAYYILAQSLIKIQGTNSTLGIAIGRDKKGIISLVIYIVGIALCFINSWISLGLYAFVACMWLVPDRRIEKKLIAEKK
ncbi:MAG: TMEM175 family protein [Bacteroidota bacterium]|nr:TMEM175 family protein [Bacteroidota bacterium]